jgi:hypothetical protein
MLPACDMCVDGGRQVNAGGDDHVHTFIHFLHKRFIVCFITIAASALCVRLHTCRGL